MYSVPGDTTSLVPGFPIRTSSDPRSVDSSPRLIAASHVLHRLPVPRHPPCALKHLQTQNQLQKKLHINCQRRPDHQPESRQPTRSPLTRCSQPLSTNQTPHPTTKTGRQQSIPTRKQGTTGLVASKPNSVFSESPPALDHSIPETSDVCHCTRTGATTAHSPSNESLTHTEPPHCRGRGMSLVVLLRKEVIQPHLPVRLPCYDFVPIADPTFDGSLPCGLGHRLRVLPTFMT